jgi:hypothetical protein
LAKERDRNSSLNNQLSKTSKELQQIQKSQRCTPEKERPCSNRKYITRSIINEKRDNTLEAENNQLKARLKIYENYYK